MKTANKITRNTMGKKAMFCMAIAIVIPITMSGTVYAANHREAPLTALDNKADITDFFAFVSYDDPDKVTFIMNVDPFLMPGNGPNYFPFDPEIKYVINIDNDHDAKEDISMVVRFNTEIRAPGVFTGFVGAGGGISTPANSPAPVAPGTALIPPAITALEGEGSEGFSLRQHYSVSIVKHNASSFRMEDDDDDHDSEHKKGYRKKAHKKRNHKLIAQFDDLVAVPANVGSRTMPDYENLARQGVYQLDNGVSVFAGTVDDPFYIDLGAAFDSLNFRAASFATGVPGVLSDEQDANHRQNYSADDLAGFNVNTIAIEVPTSMIMSDNKTHSAGDPLATIGAWAVTMRPKTKTYSQNPAKKTKTSRRFVQIQRMGNPLFNELLIGTGSKDLFSRSKPEFDAQFAEFALDPLLARVLNTIYEATVGEGVLPIPTPPRVDLLPLVQYMPPIATPGTPAGPVADILRLNTGISPTEQSQRSRLGLLGGDAAGYPNGRRVSDDVTDIAARVVVGALAGAPFNGFPHNRIGDGVNTNDREYQEHFPYVAFSNSGLDAQHDNP